MPTRPSTARPWLAWKLADRRVGVSVEVVVGGEAQRCPQASNVGPMVALAKQARRRHGVARIRVQRHRGPQLGRIGAAVAAAVVEQFDGVPVADLQREAAGGR